MVSLCKVHSHIHPHTKAHTHAHTRTPNTHMFSQLSLIFQKELTKLKMKHYRNIAIFKYNINDSIYLKSNKNKKQKAEVKQLPGFHI